jgi:hypothetical protein
MTYRGMLNISETMRYKKVSMKETFERVGHAIPLIPCHTPWAVEAGADPDEHWALQVYEDCAWAYVDFYKGDL